MQEMSVSDSTRYVVAHILHDAAANVEGYVTDYDAEALRQAEDAGMIVIAEYSDGSREVVKAADVREPEPMLNGIELVKPQYVDERMVAVVDVFEALAGELASPQPVAAMSLSADVKSDAAVNVLPGSFQQALERLKVIVNGDV